MSLAPPVLVSASDIVCNIAEYGCARCARSAQQTAMDFVICHVLQTPVVLRDANPVSLLLLPLPL